MTKMLTKYKGNLRNEVTHLQSGTTILTDAPLDNHGKGESFSPTDLLAIKCLLIIVSPDILTVYKTCNENLI